MALCACRIAAEGRKIRDFPGYSAVTRRHPRSATETKKSGPTTRTRSVGIDCQVSGCSKGSDTMETAAPSHAAPPQQYGANRSIACAQRDTVSLARTRLEVCIYGGAV